MWFSSEDLHAISIDGIFTFRVPSSHGRPSAAAEH